MRWHEKLILDERARIKAELDGVESEQGRAARLKHAMRRIGDLEPDESSLGRLRRYVYVMSALVHHERSGGLSEKQMEALAELAHAILRVQGIQPVTSSLSFLYGDLHLVASQLQRQRGRHWRAAWEQQLALHFLRRRAPGGPSFQALATGIRALRLGHGTLALRSFGRAAADEGLDATLRRRARLYHIKALRLCARTEESEKAAGALEADGGLADAERLELEWEAVCRGAVRDGDLDAMMQRVRRGKSHAEWSYVAEARLWALAVRKTAWRESLPALRTLTESKLLVPREMGFLFKCLKQLDACEDDTYDFLFRVRLLGQVLEELHLLRSVDLELLTWLAATRWLARNNAMTLATLAAREYAAASLRLTDGGNKDALGIASDLEDRGWLDADFDAGAEADAGSDSDLGHPD